MSEQQKLNKRYALKIVLVIESYFKCSFKGERQTTALARCQKDTDPPSPRAPAKNESGRSRNESASETEGLSYLATRAAAEAELRQVGSPTIAVRRLRTFHRSSAVALNRRVSECITTPIPMSSHSEWDLSEYFSRYSQAGRVAESTNCGFQGISENRSLTQVNETKSSLIEKQHNIRLSQVISLWLDETHKI